MGKSRKVNSGQLARYDRRLCPKCGKPRRLHPDGPTRCPVSNPPKPQTPEPQGSPTVTEKRITLQCRMSPEDLSVIDAVKEWYNVGDRTTAIKMVFAAEKRRIDRERARSKKTEESDD